MMGYRKINKSLFYLKKCLFYALDYLVKVNWRGLARFIFAIGIVYLNVGITRDSSVYTIAGYVFLWIGSSNGWRDK